MRKIGLEFAPGTTEHCKRLIAKLFTPTDIFDAYRMGRHKFQSGDLVLIAAEHDRSGFEVKPRIEYLKELRAALGAKAPLVLPKITMSNKTAHNVMRLPFDSDAMWIVVIRGQDIPVMCVVYATPFFTEDQAGAN